MIDEFLRQACYIYAYRACCCNLQCNIMHRFRIGRGLELNENTAGSAEMERLHRSV